MKFKARFVAVGTGQISVIHYKELFAPVLKLEGARKILAIAATKRFQIRQYNVAAAYFYGNWRKQFYMKPIPGLV